MSNERELTIDELDAVSGGADYCATSPTACTYVPSISPGVVEGGGGGGLSNTMINYGRGNAGALR